MQKAHRRHNESSKTIVVLDYKGVLYHTVIMPSSSQNTLCYISMINSFHVNLYMLAGPDCFLQNEGQFINRFKWKRLV